MINIDVQTIHSPLGANANFAMGLKGRGGGFALEDSHVRDQDIFIGYVEEDDVFMLPYFDRTRENPSLAFVKNYESGQNKKLHILEDVKRDMTVTGDSFSAGRVTATFITPYRKVRNLEGLEYVEAKMLINPAIYLRLRIKNRSTGVIKGFFAVGDMRGKYFMDGIRGIASKDGYGFATDDNGAEVFGDFDIVSAFSKRKPQKFPLSPVGGIYFDVEPGEERDVDIALAFYKPGQATFGGHELPYLYTSCFRDVGEVALFALETKERQYKIAYRTDGLLSGSGLSEDEEFLVCQSIKSYFGSTMLFGNDSGYKYVVNEGSYMMMNTCDLFADHSFFELDFMPFAVRNQLDMYYTEYSYHDFLHVDGKVYEGGISFAHDMGAFNVFSEKGSSSYEIADQLGCYSFMTAEELLNIILVTSMYINKTDDKGIVAEDVLVELLKSLENRDHPLPEFRTGGINQDSDRCGNGREITTYDSLDHSLGFTKGSLYIACKCSAAFLALQYMFGENGNDEMADRAWSGALLSAQLLLDQFDVDSGMFPATLEACGDIPILPVIEPLIYPYYLGIWEKISESKVFSELIDRCNIHVSSVLRRGICLFPDYGYKLSQSSDNSWMSKIFICKFIAERILDNNQALKISKNATDAHKKWWVRGCSTNPGIDQIFTGGQDERNFFYPRAVTSYLNVIF